MIKKTLAILFLSISSLAAHATIVNVAFEKWTINYPNYHQITDEYSADGIVFSNDPAGLDVGFSSLGLSENLVINNTLTNMFRVDFINAAPVISATITFEDSNTNAQTHMLYAFDNSGLQVDYDSFFDGGFYPNPFELTVSFEQGIVSLIAYEQPYGAQTLLNISYETQEVPEPATVWLFLSVLLGFMSIKPRIIIRN